MLIVEWNVCCPSRDFSLITWRSVRKPVLGARGHWTVRALHRVTPTCHDTTSGFTHISEEPRQSHLCHAIWIFSSWYIYFTLSRPGIQHPPFCIRGKRFTNCATAEAKMKKCIYIINFLKSIARNTTYKFKQTKVKNATWYAHSVYTESEL